MYLSKLTIENFRCFGSGDKGLELTLRPGLTALVGENDGGKTAIIDALRFLFGTTDQELQRLESTDFHRSSTSEGEPSVEVRPQLDMKMDPAEALQRAAITLKQNGQYSHPYYWAGFVFIGDGAK